MFASYRAHSTKRGFSLLELAIVVGVSGLMVGFLVNAKQSTDASNCYTTTKQQLMSVKGALDGYVRKNDRYPLPASRMLGVNDPNYGSETPGGDTTSNGIAYGALPFAALGLPTSYAGDCWGNKFTYAVTVALTTNAKSGGFLDSNVPGTIQVVTGFGGASGTTPLIGDTTAAYAVISHGADAYGAVAINYSGSSANWCPVPAAYRLNDYNCTASGNKVASSFYNNGASAGLSYFDDLVVTADKATVLTSGNLYCWGTDSDGKGILADGNTTGGHQYLSPNLAQSSAIFTKFSESGVSTTTNLLTPCAVTNDGAVYCWGNGVAVPTRVNTSIKFDKVFVRDGDYCGITSDGTAYCWGNGYNGLNGVIGGPLTDAPTTPLPTSEKFVSIVMGWGESYCGLTTTGKALCWGSRQLGHGLQEFNGTPTEVWGNHFFSKLMAQNGNSTYCAITTAADPAGAGKIFCWGWNIGGNNGACAGAANRVGIISNISKSSPIVVTTSVPHGFREGDGVFITHVQGMGQINGMYGQLENVTATSFELWPDRYHSETSDSTSFSDYVSGGNIEPFDMGSPREIGGGYTFSELIDVGKALDLNGKLYTWGDNSWLNFADGGTPGDATNGSTGINATDMTQTSPVHVTTSAAHNLTTDDYVAYQFNNWGSVDDNAPQLTRNFYQYRVVVTGPTTFDLYNRDLTPVDGTGFIPYTNADGGGYFYPIWAACSDGYGNHCSATPIAANTNQTFTNVVTNLANWVAINTLTNSQAYGWGSSGWWGGGIGDGNWWSTSSSPVPLAVPAGVQFKKVFGWPYGGTLYGMTADGHLYSWGYPSGGALGNGSTDVVVSPTPVSGNMKWRDVINASSNPYYGTVTCAIRDMSCDTPWGTKMESGDSVTAYQTPTATCTSETRTCSMGVLSGSYTNQTCM